MTNTIELIILKSFALKSLGRKLNSFEYCCLVWKYNVFMQVSALVFMGRWRAAGTTDLPGVSARRVLRERKPILYEWACLILSS